MFIHSSSVEALVCSTLLWQNDWFIQILGIEPGGIVYILCKSRQDWYLKKKSSAHTSASHNLCKQKNETIQPIKTKRHSLPVNHIACHFRKHQSCTSIDCLAHKCKCFGVVTLQSTLKGGAVWISNHMVSSNFHQSYHPSSQFLYRLFYTFHREPST